MIVDDGGYGMLRYDQDVTGADRYGVDLVTPDFVALARSFGIRAQQVDGLDDEFGAALAEHVLDPEPSVLVALTPEPLIPPPNTSPNWYRRKNVPDTFLRGAGAGVPARAPPPDRAGPRCAARRRSRGSRTPRPAPPRRRSPRAPTSAPRRSTSS